MELVVFDIGGTAIKYSRMDTDGTRLGGGSFPTPTTDAEDLLQALCGVWKEIGEGASGIAVSAPGVIEHHRYLRSGGALPYAYGLPLADLLEKRCGCPVTVANDGKCAALAELRSGALEGVQNGCALILGTGLGGGLVVGGQLVTGPHGSSGELSWLLGSFPEEGADEAEGPGIACSTSRLLRRLRSATGLSREELPDGKAAFALMDEGDAAALAAFDGWCRDVALLISNLSCILDLERVAIGGGISVQPRVLAGIQDALATLSRTLPPIFSATIVLPEVVLCRYGSEANQLGALYTYLDIQG